MANPKGKPGGNLPGLHTVRRYRSYRNLTCLVIWHYGLRPEKAVYEEQEKSPYFGLWVEGKLSIISINWHIRPTGFTRGHFVKLRSRVWN